MREIYFKKQTLGKWRRTDGESKSHVTEESMFREIQKLVNDGWKVKTYGFGFSNDAGHLRSILMTSPS